MVKQGILFHKKLKDMKKIFLIITTGFLAFSAFSQTMQDQNRHEFSLWVAGGISTMQSKLTTGERYIFKDMGALGGSVGLGYSYAFHYNWSVGTGVEFAMLRAKLNLPLISDMYTSPDGEGGLMDIKTEGKDYEETQKAFFINVPVMLKYQADLCEKGHKFYAAIGPKLGIPIMDATYKPKGNLSTSARFEGTRDFDNNAPFGDFESNTKNDELDLKLSWIAAFEAGVKWKLSDAWFLYTGLYLDLGLNEIRKGDDYDKSKNLYDFDYNDQTFNSNSMIFSQYNGEELSKKVRTLSTGVKVQITFGSSRFLKKEKLEDFSKKQQQPVVTIVEKPASQPCDALTAEQMDAIMDKHIKDLIEVQNAQNKELQEMNQLLQKDSLKIELGEGIIGFDLDKKKILPEMYSELDRKVELMNKLPNVKVTLEGHTDEQGSEQYNYELGMDRAVAARNYMISKGISPDRLKVSSKGKSEPRVKGTDENSRRINRRVEFLFQ